MDKDDRVLAYLQGRLDDADLATFEADLAIHDDLKAEVAALKTTLRVFESDTEAAATRREAGWDRLSAAIDKEDETAAPPPKPANDNRRPTFWHATGIAIAAVMAWQFIAVPFLPSRNADGFAPASQTRTDQALRIAFEDGASMADVLALLGDVGATIVDGPTSTGLYTLSFDSEAARDGAFAILSAREEIVLMVSQP